MGIDVGTTGCKVALFNQEGSLIYLAYREYPLYHPKPSWSEEDPKEVWSSITSSIREVLENVKVDPRDIVAISVSAQGEAFTPFDKDLNPLYRCITTWDDRATKEHEEFLKSINRFDLFKITGHPSSPVYTLFKLIWMKKHYQNIYERTWKFLLWEDYVNYKLCGNPAIDYSLASRTMMFDITKNTWSEEIISQAGIDIDKLPIPYPSGTVVGEVSSEASKEVGLAKGTLVVTGGHDQACGALGVGAITKGPIYVATGTVESMVATVQTPILKKEVLVMGYANYCHVVPNKFLILGANPAAGVILRWFRDNFSQEEVERAKRERRSPYDIMIEEASKVPIGSLGLLVAPYFMGAGTPNWDTKARGIILGLTLAHGRAELVRAILEGITYELRLNLEMFENLGIQVSEIRAVGGGARSKFWLQLKADITGKCVIVPEITEASSLGAAILAGIGAKVFKSIEDALFIYFKPRNRYMPNEDVKKLYDKLYSIYKRLYPTLKEIYVELFNIFSELK